MILGKGRVRPRREGIYTDLCDRRRPALSLRRHQRHLQRARTGSQTNSVRCCSSAAAPCSTAARWTRPASSSAIEMSKLGYPFARALPAHARQCRLRSHRRGLCDRSGPSNLCRAHRNPRQHPYPRLRDPARIRHRRRRSLQQDADRSGRAASEEPELLQDGQDIEQDRARRRIASCSMSRPSTSRPAISTSPAAIRRPTARSSRSR